MRKRVLDVAAVEQALTTHARRPGIGTLADAFTAYRPRAKSDLERAFDKLIKNTDIPPLLRKRIRVLRITDPRLSLDPQDVLDDVLALAR